MHKLSPRTHGWIDYLLVLFFVLAPSLFGFAGDERAALASYIVAAVHLGLSVLTAYPLGIVKLVPFPTHGWLELVAAFVLAVLPWLVGFNDDAVARNLFIVTGAAVLIVFLTTNYRSGDVGRRAMGTPLTR